MAQEENLFSVFKDFASNILVPFKRWLRELCKDRLSHHQHRFINQSNNEDINSVFQSTNFFIVAMNLIFLGDNHLSSWNARLCDHTISFCVHESTCQFAKHDFIIPLYLGLSALLKRWRKKQLKLQRKLKRLTLLWRKLKRSQSSIEPFPWHVAAFTSRSSLWTWLV